LNTLYWHDYETWGEIPALDKPSQFAGIRTDEDLNPIGEPLMVYCKPGSDVLPKPDACMITGISPQKALAEGLTDKDFIAAIERELAQPGTCGVGYNSLRFDDEVSRNGLYRNFYDPYEREWKNGNSRWDIIDMVRLCYALRPEGIEWPQNEDGKPSFKLEHLSKANGLAHDAAHDALSDVYATIALAKLVKDKQPRLYDYAYQLRSKKRAIELFDLISRKPLLHISSMFPAEKGCSALVMPLMMHPVNKNAVIVFNLMEDPKALLELNSQQVIERLYTRTDELPEGVERIPLKLVHLNKTPILCASSVLDEATQQRLQIDLDLCRQHWKQINTDIQQGALLNKLREVYEHNAFATPKDPERMLYQGFFNDHDKQTMAKVRIADENQLAGPSFEFDDPRLDEMLFRYRARNFPQSLSAQEQERWQDFCYQRFTDPEAGGPITLEDYFERIAYWRNSPELSESQSQLLDQLEEYGDSLLG